MTCGSCPCRCARRTCSACSRRPDGIFLSDFEQGEIGPDLFREAFEFGLEQWADVFIFGIYAMVSELQKDDPKPL